MTYVTWMRELTKQHWTSLAVAGLLWGCSEPSCEETLTCAAPRAAVDSGSDSSLQPLEAGADAKPGNSSPTVVSVSPANNATGVANGARIVIRFSEPMDQVATTAAFVSADLPVSEAVTSWDATGTVLTVTPSTVLLYSAGTSPSTQAKRYRYTITSHAKDLAGNHMEIGPDVSFSTLRRITQRLVADPQNLRGEAVDTTCKLTVIPATETRPASVLPAIVRVGDMLDNKAEKVWSVFELSALAPDVVQFEAATLTATQDPAKGDPYAGSLGSLILEHVHFATNDPSEWSKPALGALGVFSATTSSPVHANVLEAFRDDYTQRDARKQQSQYRLAFSQATNNDGVADVAQFTCQDGFTLDVVYLAP